MLDLVRLSPRLLFPPGGVDLYRQIALLTEMGEDDEVLDVACGKGVSLELTIGADGTLELTKVLGGSLSQHNRAAKGRFKSLRSDAFGKAAGLIAEVNAINETERTYSVVKPSTERSSAPVEPTEADKALAKQFGDILKQKAKGEKIAADKAALEVEATAKDPKPEPEPIQTDDIPPLAPGTPRRNRRYVIREPRGRHRRCGCRARP
ncbi:MAG: hypothetical protein IIB36_18750, partial [Gemmatimonadetes bacterium]|nr:hypothetical protein [Gemmatimonadota bacterium]